MFFYGIGYIYCTFLDFWMCVLTVLCFSDGEVNREELFPTQVCPGGLQGVRQSLRLALAQADLQREYPQPAHGGTVLRLQGPPLRRPQYPFAGPVANVL